MIWGILNSLFNIKISYIKINSIKLLVKIKIYSSKSGFTPGLVLGDSSSSESSISSVTSTSLSSTITSSSICNTKTRCKRLNWEIVYL